MHHSVGKGGKYFLEPWTEGGFHKGVEHCTILIPLEERFLQARLIFANRFSNPGD